MAVLAMNKIQILGLKKDLQEVLPFLQKGGVMQIDEVRSDEDTTVELESLSKKDPDLDFNLAQLDFAIKFLKDHAPKRPIWAGKPSLSLESAMGTVNEFDYKGIIKECQSLEETHVADENEITALEAESALLTEWIKLPFDLNVPRVTESTRIHIGKVPKAECAGIRAELKKMSELTSMQKIDEDETSCLLVIVISKKHADDAKLILGQHKFQEIELPVHESNIKDRIEAITARLAELAKNMEKHKDEFIRLAKNSENLQIVHDVFIWQQDETRIHEKLKGTDFSFVIEGWIAQLDREELEKDLAEIAVTAIEDVELEEDEQAPI